MTIKTLICCTALGCALAIHGTAMAAPRAPQPLDPMVQWEQQESCAHAGHEHTHPMDPAPGLPVEVLLTRVAEQQDAVAKSASGCTSAEMAALSTDDLMAFVAATDYECLRPLFTYDNDVLAVVHTDHVMAAAMAIQAATADLPGNANAITQWLTYLQIAWYHEFYQAAVAYTPETLFVVQVAVGGLTQSPDFLSLDSGVGALRRQWATTLDSVNGQSVVLPTIQALFERYNNDAAIRADYYEQSLIYSLLTGLARQIGNNAAQGVNSPWYDGATVALAAAIGALVLDEAHPDGLDYLVSNGLWALGHFKHVNPAAKLAAHELVTEAFALYPLHSTEGVWAASVLKNFFGSALADGTPVDVTALQDQLKAELFPESHSFDEGRLVFHTAIGAAKVNKLYDALQEVESQFFRLTVNTEAVANDPNENLKMYIYATPDDYKTYHPFLFNLSTNNGGIYIEQQGSFFTYDRTPQQSSYTLEELTRHEYVHYLDGRYNVTGAFGDANSLYTKTKFTWFVEGLAEYLAGSTRMHYILPRLTLTDLIAHDASLMTPQELLNVTYNSGFRFYQYAGMFFAYLQRNEPQRLLELFWKVRSNDIDAVKLEFDALKADANTALGYSNYLATLLTERATNTGLFAEDIGTTYRAALLPGQNAAELEALLMAAGANDSTPTFTVTNDRFLYEGTISAAVFVNAAFMQAIFSQSVNNRLEALEGLLPNFHAATGWFGAFSSVVNGQVQTRIRIEGPYNPNDTSLLIHTCDTTVDGVISLSELLRMIQFYNAGSLHCDAAGEDGFAPGFGGLACMPHLGDYAPQDWSISLSELLRMIQFYNAGGYHPDPQGEDGFASGAL
jgi:microbial collagenase